MPVTFLGTLQDSKGRWNQYTGRYAWDAGCICSGDEQYGGTGQPKEGSCFGAAPNVDHSNERVRKVTPCPHFTAFCIISLPDISASSLRLHAARSTCQGQFPRSGIA